jgi:hypothetical protein
LKERKMARKDYTPEQVIGMLREADVRLSQGEKIARGSQADRGVAGLGVGEAGTQAGKAKR